MEFRLYIQMLQRGWWMIALTTLVALNAALVSSYLATPLYRSSSRFVVSPNPDLITGRDVVNSLEALDKRSIISTYAEFLNSRRIYKETLSTLGLTSDDVEDYEISTVVLPDANILELTVTGPDPNVAALLANSTGKRAIDYIRLLYSAYDISILDPATPPSLPFSPQPTRDASVAVALGLIGGAALAILSEQLRIPLEAYRQRLRIDSATGVYNNRHFRNMVEQELMSKPNGLLAVGIVELSGLHEVMETLPPVGTQRLLRMVTEVLRKELRGNDVIGRWDETSFVLMLPSTPVSAATRTFERIYKALSQPIDLEQYDLLVALNPAVGCSVYRDGISANEFLSHVGGSVKTARRNPEHPVFIEQVKGDA